MLQRHQQSDVLKCCCTDAHVPCPSSNLPVVRMSQIRKPQSSAIAVEIDGAAVAEGCALIVESKAVLDIDTATQLLKGIEIIK